MALKTSMGSNENIWLEVLRPNKSPNEAYGMVNIWTA